MVNYSDNIKQAVQRVALGQQKCLYLGNLSEVRDWPEITTTVREFVQMTFAEYGIELAFSGKNEYEKGVVIDVDYDLARSQGIDTDKIHFGNTVVKVDETLAAKNL